ncbi:MAG: GNAT family N-acetyltransferase [Prevotellaceae bacterium]|jgi:diamine N-acetyltransferase|nr:GNAT family N-acetyltransferase [Prevotellaceae bacterium]
MLKNENITLRAVEPEDLEFLYQCENLPSLWAYGNRKEPFSRFALKEYVSNCDQTIYERGQLRFMVVFNGTNETIGTVDLFNFDYHNGRAETGIFIVENFQRRGYGLQTLQLLTDYAFNLLNIHQLYAFVVKENSAAAKLFHKAGFEHNATLKNWFFHKGEYWHTDIFQKFKK